MKRLICFSLSLVIAFVFCACGKENTSSNENSVDIEYFAKLGEIPECEYAIGDSVIEIKEHLSAAQESEAQEEGHAHSTYEVVEGEKTVLIDSGSYGYYYVKEKEANGISYIVSYEKAYGFEIGQLIIDVKKSLEKLNYKEEPLSEDNAFFMFGSSGTVLKCEIGDYTVLFVFDNDALCATAIYLTEDWV